MTRPAGLHSMAKPLVEREPDYTPQYADPRDVPLEFELTPLDQAIADRAGKHLKEHVRRLNQPHIERNAREGREI